jgi:2-dehydro-3-deoxygluconokinase
VRFVAVGDAFVDVVGDAVLEPGRRRHGHLALRVGGSAVNAALAAAKLGADAVAIGRVGRDAAGDLIFETLETHGIAASLARDSQLPTGVVVALGDGVVADRGANASFARADVPDTLRGDALLVSGFALFQEGSREAAETALVRFDGRWAALDLASPKLAAGADLSSLRANVVFATPEEADVVSGLEHVEIVCVKHAHGATASRGSETVRAQAAPIEEKSPFGSGDALAATFLVRLSEGASLRAALEQACAAGAQAVSS